MPKQRHKDDLLSDVEALTTSLEELSDAFDLYTVFVDLCDSTELKQFCIDEEIPDSVWIIRQRIFLGRVASLMQSHGATIIKTIGDEVMATFPVDHDPRSIIKCVLEVFQSFDNLQSYDKGRFKIQCKGAIDFGTCYDGQLLHRDIVDPIGPSVDRCARIGKIPKANQLVLSADVYTLLTEKDFDFKKMNLKEHTCSFKGLGEVRCYVVDLE